MMSSKFLRFIPKYVDQIVGKSQTRNFFAYLRIAFNSVDQERLQEVGPDRLCAEWIVKNGGTVQFKDQTDAITDYNQLQDDHVHGTSKLWKVDGSESSIMSLGFHHFKGCHFVEKIRLHRCKYMENDGLEKLGYLKNSLKELEVTECHNVEKDALLSLKQLQCLKILTIHGFTYINDDDFKTVSNELQKNLPNCQIITKV